MGNKNQYHCYQIQYLSYRKQYGVTLINIRVILIDFKVKVNDEDVIECNDHLFLPNHLFYRFQPCRLQPTNYKCTQFPPLFLSIYNGIAIMNATVQPRNSCLFRRLPE
jgi:hypothetical protein